MTDHAFLLEHLLIKYIYRKNLLMTPTIVQLRNAALVAEVGSFSEAARRANMSQPSISASVSDLEGMLGRSLFARTTRKVELTAFGRALMPSVHEVLAALSNLQHEAAALIEPERKMIRVAYSPLLDIRRVDAMFSRYRRDNPAVEVIFKECSVGGLEKRLVDEQVDIAFGVGLSAERGRSRCALFEDRLHLVPPFGFSDSPTVEKELRELRAETILLTSGECGLAPATEALLVSAGIDVCYYVGRAMSHTALQEWAELGLGAALLPASRITGDAGRFPGLVREGQPVTIRHEAVWLKDVRAVPHINAFLKGLPEIARAMAKSGVWA
ncbi:MAG: LysR family transcriptional regulator [Pseudomonadota bacterium]|nr:LysR family transcriptional regulator [Pseudomonadota bacterium]